jgi:protein-tyrosine phosphatase
MDGEHLSDVGDLARACGMRGRLVRLLDYADPQTVHGRRDVPDPYYTGQFDLVYDLIDHATDGLLTEIQRAAQQNNAHGA